MDACETIDRVLINIQGQITQIFDYKSYSHKAPNIRTEQFRLNVADFESTLNNELNALERIPYLVEQCTDLIESLENKLSKKSLIQIPQSFRNAQLAALKKITNHINSFIADLTKEISNSDSLAAVKHDDVVLSSPQVALFILYLRDVKFISANVTDSKVAEFYGKMTGYSPEQIRKAIAGVNRFERNQITQLESNYNELKRFLGIIIDRIEADKRKAILKKDK